MDPVLTPQQQQQYFTFSDEPEFDSSEKLSLWTIEGEIIRPSTSLKILKNFPSGVFKVDISKEIGYYSTRIDVKSDGLINFDDDLIPSMPH